MVSIDGTRVAMALGWSLVICRRTDARASSPRSRSLSASRSRPATCGSNSLLWPIYSLLRWTGNLEGNGSVAAISLIGCPRKRPNLLSFPVKFPLCRELVMRPVRLTLRRQPASADFREFSTLTPGLPENSGLLRGVQSRGDLYWPMYFQIPLEIPKVSTNPLRNSGFAETCKRDWRINFCMRGRAVSEGPRVRPRPQSVTQAVLSEGRKFRQMRRECESNHALNVGAVRASTE